mgnify:CR=1 FL=1
MGAPEPFVFDPEGTSAIVHGENLTVLESLPDEAFSLVYLDPPFNTGRDQVRRTTDQLIRTGKAEYPVIGLDFDPNYTGTGVKVSRVVDGGPAAKAGLKEGDVINSIDGVATKDPKTYLVTLRSKDIGQTITVGYNSGGNQKSVTMQTAAGS